MKDPRASKPGPRRSLWRMVAGCLLAGASCSTAFAQSGRLWPSTHPANPAARIPVTPPGSQDSMVTGVGARTSFSAPFAGSNDAIGRQADQKIQQGISLAERGAYYSARAQFFEALKMISQLRDAQQRTLTHSDALVLGLQALQEADDFHSRGTSLESGRDLTEQVRNHRTPVLKDADLRSIGPLAAMQSYYAFAQQQLRVALGEEPAASRALYALGRLSWAEGLQVAAMSNLAGPKAIALHQAAIGVDPRNYMSANELGVLLARYGQYSAARKALLHSLAVSPQPETWQNLAKVQEQLGAQAEAQQARQQAEALYALRAQGGDESRVGEASLRWVTPEELARVRSPAGIDEMPQIPRAAGDSAASARSPARPPQKNALKNFFGY